MGLFFVFVMFMLFYLKVIIKSGEVIILSDNLLSISMYNPEIERAWSLLPDGDPVAENSGEVWQYMGTELNGCGDRGWRHCFRHRCYKDEGRVYKFFPVSENWALPKRRIGWKKK